MLTDREELCASGALNSYYGERWNDIAATLGDVNVSADLRRVVAGHIRLRYMQNIPYGVQTRINHLQLEAALLVNDQPSVAGVMSLPPAVYTRIQWLCSEIDKRNGLVPDYATVYC